MRSTTPQGPTSIYVMNTEQLWQYFSRLEYALLKALQHFSVEGIGIAGMECHPIQEQLGSDAPLQVKEGSNVV